MPSWLLALIMVAAFAGGAFAQEDKKTDDLQPADPDTGESTVEEETLGLLSRTFDKQGVKLAMTYIGEGLGNPTGGANPDAAYENRIKLRRRRRLREADRSEATDFPRQRVPD
jgi:porin